MIKTLTCLLFLTSVTVYSQVGIGTGNPRQQFYIDGGKDNPASGAHSAAQANNDLVVTATGNMGIGTISPAAKLDIANGSTAGAIKITDGTQGKGKVLTSDEDVVGTWQNTSNTFMGLSINRATNTPVAANAPMPLTGILYSFGLNLNTPAANQFQVQETGIYLVTFRVNAGGGGSTATLFTLTNVTDGNVAEVVSGDASNYRIIGSHAMRLVAGKTYQFSPNGTMIACSNCGQQMSVTMLSKDPL
ncbi:hypothetical protein [Chryseobacterium sp. BIGb0232]|uniref:hypothetical protein n=1 Tax=Chryseobacterium sp. BIGb0232 TaxID=2940598 RepID=UPI000FB0D40D|nr:hypothetical protein [Chryseobacterium sp. BIGb0232]MCS4300934.1 hypothetical protein [Chryseobacterium sp. BIGb0232]ROS20198.1 hypothetical protein EDF65_0903 [Chryseobacterium nakagawai]